MITFLFFILVISSITPNRFDGSEFCRSCFREDVASLKEREKDRMKKYPSNIRANSNKFKGTHHKFPISIVKDSNKLTAWL